MSERQETASKAKPFYGRLSTLKLYHERARSAFPLLVRQAQAERPITYSDLASELGITNPKTLNYVLGSIGQSLIILGREWGEEIPPIQSLVINKANELPGDGIGLFITKDEYRKMTKSQKKAVFDLHAFKIYAYPKWAAVLEAFGMEPANDGFSGILKKAGRGGWGGGESEHHRTLKHYVAGHPEIVGLPPNITPGITEEPIPSGDKLDVLFQRKEQWIAVEVKSKISADADLARGMFQCVKYQAVMEAALRAIGKSPDVRALLVCARPLTPELVSLKNRLGVEVVVIAEPPLTPGRPTIVAPGSTRYFPSFP